MNNEYYFENSNFVCLTENHRKKLEKQLTNYKCKVCGNNLVIATLLEGTNIICYEEPWKHKCGYIVNTDNPRNEKEPYIEEYNKT
jgi:hypothetical protein